MIRPTSLSVILLAAFSTIHTLHLPTLSNQTLGSPSKLASVWECTFVRLDIPPHYGDCVVAYEQLPLSDIPGTFHDTGEDDEYKLPVKRSYKTCALSIFFLDDGPQQEDCSWAEIALRAEVLNDLCVNGRNTGGYIEMGQYSRIRIELGGVKEQSGTLVGGGEVDVT